jgi:hypothetical protein
MKNFHQWLNESGLFHHKKNPGGQKFPIDAPGQVAADAAEENGLNVSDAIAFFELLSQRLELLKAEWHNLTTTLYNKLGHNTWWEGGYAGVPENPNKAFSSQLFTFIHEIHSALKQQAKSLYRKTDLIKSMTKYHRIFNGFFTNGMDILNSFPQTNIEPELKEFTKNVEEVIKTLKVDVDAFVSRFGIT